MKRAPLGDVVVRARGLARHLLDRSTLLRLARSSGTGALATALENLGYWPAPSAPMPVPASDSLERSIEHETARRLAVLVRWLADRAPLLAPLFELEERDLLRVRLRELAAGEGSRTRIAPETRGGWPALRDLRTAVARASDLAEASRILTRLGSPWAMPIAGLAGAGAGAETEVDTRLEAIVDRSWAARARDAASRGLGAVRAFVEDEIDLHNAWDALAGGTGSFLPGGRRIEAPLHQAISKETDETRRRQQLALAFSGSAMAGVFEDPTASPAALEARSRAARIASTHRAARLDPLGASPIVEVVLRIRAERADLRCIVFGVAAGMPWDAIADRLAVAP